MRITILFGSELIALEKVLIYVYENRDSFWISELQVREVLIYVYENLLDWMSELVRSLEKYL